MKEIIIKGIRVHNLQNIDISIPLEKITVVTGLSGSGKSSLIFDTVYSESSRRFIESLGTYSRTYLTKLPAPDIDFAENIPPAIAVRFTPLSKSARSTVGTVTEIYDYLRLLYTRLGVVWCSRCKIPLKAISPSIAAEKILEKTCDDMAIVTFPIEIPNANDLKKLIASGFFRILENGDLVDLTAWESSMGRFIIPGKKLNVVVDRIELHERNRTRLSEAIELAYKNGDGKCGVFFNDRMEVFTEEAICKKCGNKYQGPSPVLFSFNNPLGACPKCKGFGDIITYDINKVIPDKSKTINEGAIQLLELSRFSYFKQRFLNNLNIIGIPRDIPMSMLSEKHRRILWDGNDDIEGIVSLFDKLQAKRYRMDVRSILSKYRKYSECLSCKGSRLRKEVLNIKIGTKNIASIVRLPLTSLHNFIVKLEMEHYYDIASKQILEQIKTRLAMLIESGVGYLQLNRLARSLSGGELQRINLINAVGAKLTGALYVMDEPSIGLHPIDEEGLKKIILGLKDSGNTVLIAEHSRTIIDIADKVIELGPQAGEAGGKIIFSGSLDSFRQIKGTITSNYYNNIYRQETPDFRRKPEKGFISIINAEHHNLKKLNIDIPLGLFTCLTGPSGAGKSTLVIDVLYKYWLNRKMNDYRVEAGRCEWINGLDNLKEIILIEGGQIARSPRSCTATYMGIFNEIRNLFAGLMASRAERLKPENFSFNTKAGQCPVCNGNGMITVDMQFLPDVHIICEACNGTRFKSLPLKVKYKGMNIHDVLQLTVEMALQQFKENDRIVRKLNLLEDVNLGYLRLGQPLSTLSSGEAARLKLARFINKRSIRNRLYIFDEPSLGLHPYNIKKLLKIFTRLIANGATIICIDHNLDIIKTADYIIDLGPGGGKRGGKIVAAGTPEEISANPKSVTGKYLRDVISDHDDLERSKNKTYTDWAFTRRIL